MREIFGVGGRMRGRGERVLEKGIRWGWGGDVGGDIESFIGGSLCNVLV